MTFYLWKMMWMYLHKDIYKKNSVPDPDPDPLDPHVFGPPGSGSTSQRSGSGSGSLYHHEKIVRKTLTPSILWLFLSFYLWKMMYMYLQKVISKKNCVKIYFLLESWRSMRKIAGSGSISQKHGSEDPDPPQNVMDPEHWEKLRKNVVFCWRLEVQRWK